MMEQTFYRATAVAAMGIAALLSAVLTPIIQRAALRNGAAHTPRARDMHVHPVARWGGVAIYAALLLTFCLALAVIHWGLRVSIHAPSLKTWLGILLGG